MPLPNLDTDDIKYLRRQFVAWMEGAEARADGQPLTSNPHKPRTGAGDAWENGWERIDWCIKDAESAKSACRLSEANEQDDKDRGGNRCYDAAKALEDWTHKEKCRWAKLEIDDGFGATCWRVELHRGRHTVFCTETNFLQHEGVDPLWHEREGNLYCCVVNGNEMDDWPGLAATIRRAIECAEKFWPS